MDQMIGIFTRHSPLGITLKRRQWKPCAASVTLPAMSALRPIPPCFTERARVRFRPLKQWERANQPATRTLIRRGPVKHPRAPHATTFGIPEIRPGANGMPLSGAAPMLQRGLQAPVEIGERLWIHCGAQSRTSLGILVFKNRPAMQD